MGPESANSGYGLPHQSVLAGLLSSPSGKVAANFDLSLSEQHQMLLTGSLLRLEWRSRH
jgi:hypothetical protein